MFHVNVYKEYEDGEEVNKKLIANKKFLKDPNHLFNIKGYW